MSRIVLKSAHNIRSSSRPAIYDIWMLYVRVAELGTFQAQFRPLIVLLSFLLSKFWSFWLSGNEFFNLKKMWSEKSSQTVTMKLTLSKNSCQNLWWLDILLITVLHICVVSKPPPFFCSSLYFYPWLSVDTKCRAS